MTIDELVGHLRGRRSGHGWSCHCPSHNDKTPSLWLTQKEDGGIFVNCQAGCSSEQVLAALDQKGWLNGFKSLKLTAPLSREQQQRAEFLSDCVPIWGTVGERYLEGRGLTALPPSVVFHPKAKELMGVWYPAIVAKVQRPDGTVTSYQCTYLLPDGTDARSVFGVKRRQTYGALEGGAVVFPGAALPMVIAESWETAATVWEATGRMTLASLGLMNASKLELPAGVEVWLAGEADPAGSQGAETQTKVVRTLQRKKHLVRVLTPIPYDGVKGTDWSDVAQREGLGAVTEAWAAVPDKVKTEAELRTDAANHTADMAAGLDDSGGTAGGSSGNGADWLLDLNKKHAVVSIGGKTRILSEVPQPTGLVKVEYSGAEDFRLKYNNQQVTMLDAAGNAIVQKKGDAWINSPARRQYEQVVMWPGNTDKSLYNLWKGFAITAEPGDWSLFKQHIKDNIAGGIESHYDYIVGWLAFCVQKLTEKPEVALVLKGGKGTGKSFFAESVGKMFGRHFIMISRPEQLLGHFNMHMADKVLVFGDEAIWGGNKSLESSLKTLITARTMVVEGKGQDMMEMMSCHRLIMASNDDWVVPASQDERRYAVFEMGEGAKQDRGYFGRIATQLEAGGYAAMLHDLLAMDISKFNVADVPRTEGLRDQQLETMDMLHKWWFAKLTEGTLAINGFDFDQHVPTKWLHHDYLEAAGKLRRTYLEDERSFGKKFIEMLRKGSQNTWDSESKPMTHVLPGRGNDTPHRMTAHKLPTVATAREWFNHGFKAAIDWDEAGLLEVVSQQYNQKDLLDGVPF